MEKSKVVVGMSGGVDSSVAAYLLLQGGYDVIGITMQVWQADETLDSDCCGVSAVSDAQRVASKLGIPYYVLNFKDVFKKKVIDYFISEYKCGRTPNPCIACNRYVKWEALLNRALALGADFIATGHYAQILKTSSGRFTLKKAQSKDQTYALYSLTQHQLKNTLMPLGGYSKDYVRQIARDIGLCVADKPDSQEICFVPDNDYTAFINKDNPVTSLCGNFVDIDGNFLGLHKGITHYTIGQRKGLGISLGRRMFVCNIDAATNEVVLSDEKQLFNDTLFANNLNFTAIDKLNGTLRVLGKIRYSHNASPCHIRMLDDDVLECKFDVPQRAITPGQAVVFYDGDMLIGGGTILNRKHKKN